MLYVDGGTAETKLYGIPLRVDPLIPRGMAAMQDGDGKMVFFDLRTDAEKAEDEAGLRELKTRIHGNG
jgi:hypothetical protein